MKPSPSARRIGIVNRGEPAVRFLAALETFGPQSPDPVTGVALYTDADAGADWIRRADAAARIGAGRSAYLDAGAVIDGLRATGCDAAWLGWGFASEDGAFAGALEAAGITVLGPRAETMTALGDKIRAKRLAEAHDVPVAPWAVVADAAGAEREARRIGFPLLLKAAGGGGGRGIRRVDRAEDVAGAFVAARDEAARSFGGEGVFLEKLVAHARHIEVQVLGDGEGGVRIIGVRDCSLQRRRQKVIEECMAPHLPAAIEASVTASARRLCEAVRYRSAGTVEFLYDLDADAAWFLEVNTRLQVEHTVTEAVFGVDLVQAQIELARGGALPEIGAPRGWAVEARVCAEDTRRDFTPAPGRLVRFAAPTGPGLRVDTGFVEGETIAPEFDPLIAKIIAWGPDRPTALARLAGALDRTRIIVEGGASNLVFLRDLLRHRAVRTGEVHIGLVDAWSRAPARDAGVAMLAAAIDRFVAHGDRADGPERHRVEAGENLRVHRLGPEVFRVRGAGGAVTVRYAEVGPHEHRIEIGRDHWRIERAPGDTRYLVDGEPHGVAAASGGSIAAPSAALVLDCPVRVGDRVEAGAAVVVLESMKMEVRVECPHAGTVREVHAHPGDQVAAGQLLVVVEPEGGVRRQTASPIPWQADAGDRVQRLRAALIGWDFDREGLLDDAAAVSAAACPALLDAFADVADLFDRRPHRGLTSHGARPVTADVWLDTVEQRGPASQSPERAARLERALAHHGLDTVEPGPALDDALLRLRRAGAALAVTRAAAAALLARLEDDLAAPVDVRLLDRLAGLDPEQFPGVAEAADRVRYTRVELPAHRRLLARARAEATRLLERLEDDRGEHDWSPVHDAPESLVPGFAPRAVAGSAVAAEAVARRLEGFDGGPGCAVTRLGRRPAFACDEGRTLCVTVRPDEVREILSAAAARDGLQRLVVVIAGTPALPDPAAALDGLLASLALPAGVPWRELCLVAVGAGPTAVRWLDAEGRPRDTRRDVLPSSARRLDLDRLSGFDLQRLPSPPDVVLFRAVGQQNPADVRLLAYGEIRSLERTPGTPISKRGEEVRIRRPEQGICF